MEQSKFRNVGDVSAKGSSPVTGTAANYGEIHLARVRATVGVRARVLGGLREEVKGFI